MPDHRGDFLRLAADLHRELAAPLPPMHLESEETVAARLNHGDAPFEVIHSLALHPSSLLVDYEVGPVPEGVVDEIHSWLLRASGELFRTRQVCIGIDDDRQAVVCSQWRPLSSLAATGLLVEARAWAAPLRRWASAGWHEEPLSEIVEASASSPWNSTEVSADWRQGYRAVVESLGVDRARAGGARNSDVDPIAEVELFFERTRFTAVHSLAEPHRLTLEVALGQGSACPVGTAARWLRLNRELSRGECAALGMHRQRDLVIFACAVDLEGLSVTALQERMADITGWIAGSIN